ncbi:DUF4296 domain-containing protein [Parabacteroides sp. Marseille-P3160]|uniref:DUF4296 domain-containing protein n=1 Tax=Parabacteroides sp. Marseille-P3160 TaxID=1917887 RepID=UPI0009BBDCB0|nr:DUF4296 domain-containing protein [Parabacteroides sp. Marseille-P3160]
MWNRFHKYGLALLVLMTSFSCGRTPDGILSQKKMKEVTLDIKLAEAMIEADYNAYTDYSRREALYRSVFEKHKITEAVYDSSLIWYGENLEVYMEIYNQLGNELDGKIKEMGDIKPEKEMPVSPNDSIDIWPLRRLYTFTPDHPRLIAFDMKPEIPYTAGSVFVLGVNIWGMTPQTGPAPELRLTVEQSDTTMTVLKNLDRDGYFETEVQTLPSQQVRRVFGYIRMMSNRTEDLKIYIDSLSLFKYHYGFHRIAPPAEVMP